MSSLVTYLLECSGILAVLYALYWVLLRNETFFRFNRFFLLATLAFSFVGPLLRLDESLPAASIIDQPLKNWTICAARTTKHCKRGRSAPQEIHLVWNPLATPLPGRTLPPSRCY